MATQRLKVLLDYCSFYIAGSLDVDVPYDRGKVGVQATAECINVPGLPWNEGDTTITLGAYADVVLSLEPAYDGLLETPMKSVMLFDASIPLIMEAIVESAQTRVRIWINNPIGPDEVTIALG